MSCLPEWNLLKWIRRELKLLLRTPVAVGYHCKVVNDIIATMDDTFTDWPEDLD